MNRRRPLSLLKNCFHISSQDSQSYTQRRRRLVLNVVLRSVASRVPELEHAPGDFVGHVRRHEPRDRARCLRARAHFDPRPAARHERPQTEHLLGRDEAVLRQVPPAARTALISSRECFSSTLARRTSRVSPCSSPMSRSSMVSERPPQAPPVPSFAPARRRTSMTS